MSENVGHFVEEHGRRQTLGEARTLATQSCVRLMETQVESSDERTVDLLA